MPKWLRTGVIAVEEHECPPTPNTRRLWGLLRGAVWHGTPGHFGSEIVYACRSTSEPVVSDSSNTYLGVWPIIRVWVAGSSRPGTSPEGLARDLARDTERICELLAGPGPVPESPGAGPASCTGSVTAGTDLHGRVRS